VRRQPLVDALHVVQVLAKGKPPHLLAGLHRAKADRALLPVDTADPSRRLGVRELRQLGDVHADPLALCRRVAGGGDWCAASDTGPTKDYEDRDDSGAREGDAGVAECRGSFRRWVVVVRRYHGRGWADRRSHCGSWRGAGAYGIASVLSASCADIKLRRVPRVTCEMLKNGTGYNIMIW
jgi:hypothetical protein